MPGGLLSTPSQGGSAAGPAPAPGGSAAGPAPAKLWKGGDDFKARAEPERESHRQSLLRKRANNQVYPLPVLEETFPFVIQDVRWEVQLTELYAIRPRQRHYTAGWPLLHAPFDARGKATWRKKNQQFTYGDLDFREINFIKHMPNETLEGVAWQGVVRSTLDTLAREADGIITRVMALSASVSEFQSEADREAERLKREADRLKGQAKGGKLENVGAAGRVAYAWWSGGKQAAAQQAGQEAANRAKKTGYAVADKAREYASIDPSWHTRLNQLVDFATDSVALLHAAKGVPQALVDNLEEHNLEAEGLDFHVKFFLKQPGDDGETKYNVEMFAWDQNAIIEVTILHGDAELKCEVFWDDDEDSARVLLASEPLRLTKKNDATTFRFDYDDVTQQVEGRLEIQDGRYARVRGKEAQSVRTVSFEAESRDTSSLPAWVKSAAMQAAASAQTATGQPAPAPPSRIWYPTCVEAVERWEGKALSKSSYGPRGMFYTSSRDELVSVESFGIETDREPPLARVNLRIMKDKAPGGFLKKLSATYKAIPEKFDVTLTGELQHDAQDPELYFVDLEDVHVEVSATEGVKNGAEQERLLAQMQTQCDDMVKRLRVVEGSDPDGLWTGLVLMQATAGQYEVLYKEPRGESPPAVATALGKAGRVYVTVLSQRVELTNMQALPRIVMDIMQGAASGAGPAPAVAPAP